MSEIKGALLGVVLAVSAFTVIYAIINTSLKNATDTIGGRLEDASALEPLTGVVTTRNYSYHF